VLLEPTDGSTGQATPSRPLVRSWGTRGQLDVNRRYQGSNYPSAIEDITLFMITFRHRSCVHSFFHSTLYVSTLRLSNDGALTYHFHDLKITLTSATHMESPASHQYGRGLCTITSVLSLLPWLVQPPPQLLPLLSVHAFRYTRAAWVPAMIHLWGWVLGCNFETYRYSCHLLTCRSFSFLMYIYNFHPCPLGHDLMKSTITTFASYPYIQVILHL